MLLKELCVLDVACCGRDITIVEAARIMRERHVGDLIVIDDADDRQPAGILTDRDIVVEVVAKGRDPGMTTAGEIMVSRLVVATGSEDLESALERMRTHGIRRIPVLDERGRILGIVTLDDLLRVHAEQAAAFLQIVGKEQVRENRARR